MTILCLLASEALSRQAKEISLVLASDRVYDVLVSEKRIIRYSPEVIR